MKTGNSSSILLICVVFALTTISFSSISWSKKRPKKKIPISWLKTKTAKIGYPKGWSLLEADKLKKGLDLRKIHFYFRHYWYENKRPSKGWADMEITWVNSPGWNQSKWPLDEFLKDKDCGISKCHWEDFTKHPSSYIDDSCPRIVEYPCMFGGYCGHFIKKISVSGSTGYLFRDKTSDPNTKEFSLFFKKGKKIYNMEFHANKKEFDYFMDYFQVFISNFK